VIKGIIWGASVCACCEEGWCWWGFLETPRLPVVYKPKVGLIGADSMGHGGHVPPHFYKWLGAGAP